MKPSRRAIFIAVAGSLFSLLPVLVHTRLWTFWPVFVAWLFLALGFEAIFSPRRSAVACKVELPPTLYIGDSDVAQVEITIAARRPVLVELIADLSERLVPQPVLSQKTTATPARFEVALVPRRRGTVKVETIWVRYGGILGLLEFSTRFEIDREIPVVPDIQPVRSAALRFFSDRSFRSGMKIERFRGDGTEFDSMKQFIRGDDQRGIDWKASARHRKLVVRQFRAERNHQVILVLDTGHLMAETLGGVPKLDHALNAALLVSHICLRSGDRVGLYTFDSQVGLFLEPQGGMRAYQAMTHASSQIDYSSSETNFTLGLATLSHRVRRRSLLIVLTDFVDTVTAELMLENLNRLSRRHLVIFVALRNPSLVRTAATAPVDAFQLSRAVVARSLIGDRESVLRRLQRMGVFSIDAEPRQIGTRLINSYLDIKRREMI